MGAIASIAKSLAGAGVGALLLGYLGIVKRFEYAGRYFVYILIIIVSALYGVSSSLVFSLAGKRGLAQWSTGRVCNFLVQSLLNIRFEVEGSDILESNRPAIFISNHQSDLDVGMLGQTFPKYCSVTAKRALKYYPFLGWFMWASGTVFIDRANRQNALQAFSAAKDHMLKNKQSVFMFPEGTRSHALDLSLLPFKKGAFHFAIQAQVPLVPYVVQNYSQVWSHKKKEIHTGRVRVKVLKPIETKGLTKEDAGMLAEKTYKAMLQAYNEMGFAR